MHSARPAPSEYGSPELICPRTVLILADRMRPAHLPRNLRPVARLFCNSALFSRSGMSGMAAYRQTFQQTVLLLLAALRPSPAFHAKGRFLTRYRSSVPPSVILNSAGR